MRLLFDENLAASLPRDVSDLYPGSNHVLALGLAGAKDSIIWQYAIAGGYVLVTKDEDFQRFSVLRGSPPKVIWIRLGNCTTADVVRLLRFRREHIAAFVESPTADFLALG